MFEVVCTNRNGYINFEIKGHSEIIDVEVGDQVISRESQIPDIETPFKTLMINQDDYEDLDLVQWVNYKKELKAVLPSMKSFQPNAQKNPDFWLGCEWKDTKLKAQLDKIAADSGSASQSTTDAPSQESEKPVVEDKSSEKADNIEPVIEFSDDIPF